MSTKEKLAKAFRPDPDRVVASNQTLVQQNAKTSLLYQLEQRKTQKLEETVAQLNERIRALTSKRDDARIELLVADRVKRKLSHLKAITNKTIASLESGLKEFQNFVTDIDQAISDQSKLGALQDPVTVAIKPELLLPRFQPRLARVAESPMVGPITDVTNLQAVSAVKSKPSPRKPSPQKSKARVSSANVSAEAATKPNAATTANTIIMETFDENQRSSMRMDTSKRNTRSSRNKAGQLQSPMARNSLSDTMNMEDEFLTPTSQLMSRNSDQGIGRKSSISKHVVLADLNHKPKHTSTPKQKHSVTQKLHVDFRGLDINKTINNVAHTSKTSETQASTRRSLRRSQSENFLPGRRSSSRKMDRTNKAADNSGIKIANTSETQISTRKSLGRSHSANLPVARRSSARKMDSNKPVDNIEIKIADVSEKQTPAPSSLRRSARSESRKSRTFTSPSRRVNKIAEIDALNAESNNRSGVVSDSVVDETVANESMPQKQKKSVARKNAPKNSTPASIREVPQMFSNITERCRSKLSTYKKHRLSSPPSANNSNAADSIEYFKPKRIRREKKAYSPSDLHSSNPNSLKKQQNEAAVVMGEQSNSAQFADQSNMESQSLHTSTINNSTNPLSEKRKRKASSKMAIYEDKSAAKDNILKSHEKSGKPIASKVPRVSFRITPNQTPSTSAQNSGTLEQSSTNFSAAPSSRQKRTVAAKVASYKLPALNIKMRRE